MFGNEDPFSDFFKTFFGGGGGAARRREGRGRGRAARAQKGRDIEHEVELDARGGVPRRHAPHLDQAGRSRPHRRRPDPGRRQGRLARPRRRRRGNRRERRRRRRPVPARASCGRTRCSSATARTCTPRSRCRSRPRCSAARPRCRRSPARVRLKIPETTQNGQVFRLKGHGMPIVGKPDERGDLYAAVTPAAPLADARSSASTTRRCAKLTRTGARSEQLELGQCRP